MKVHPSSLAFTLVELLVVIAIVGLLSSIVLVVTVGLREQADIAKTLQWARSVESLLGADAVGIWNLDENPAIHGTTISDLSGWGNNGTLYTNDGATDKSVPGVINNALSFDGVDDYVNVPNPHSLLTSVSVETWIKPDTTQPENQGDVVSKVYEYQLSWQQDTEKIMIQYYTDDPAGWKILTSLGTVPNSTWGHVVCSFEPSGANTIAKIYINGKLDKQDTLAGRPKVWTTFTIGSYWTGNRWYYKGLIDEVRIYEAALTTAQIQSQYYAGLDRLLAKGLMMEQEYQQHLVKN